MVAVTGGCERLRFSSGRRSVVVAGGSMPITPAEHARLADMAAKLLRDAPSLGRSDLFGGQVATGLSNAPAVLLGDQREIGLHAMVPTQRLEHRIAALSADGDFLLVEHDCPSYERYLTALLGNRSLRVIAIGSPRPGEFAPVATRCRDLPPVLAQLVTTARDAGCFQVMPHIGAASAWMLASAIAAEAGVPVMVAAPPPRLTRLVNDKIWFANRVRAVLGEHALPPTFSAFGPAAVASRMAHLARRHEKIVVKTPDSAGSMGNVVIRTALIRGLQLSGIRKLVLRMLRGRGWQGDFPLLVGVWEIDAVASPSVQVWIPGAAQGGPLVEGIFEQQLAGAGAEFVGAVPARLPRELASRLRSEALLLATLFQDLGYFGRCSFDCLVSASAADGTRLHWIECNGRWGGVSLPMSLANRLAGDYSRLGFVVVQSMGQRLVVKGVDEALRCLGPLLLERGGTEGVILLSAGTLQRGEGVHLLAVAGDQQRAEALASQAVQLLLRDATTDAGDERC